MLGCESGWTDRQRHSLFELSDSGAAGKWTWAAIGGGFGQVIQEVRSDRTCPSASSAKCTLGHMSLDGRQPALQSSYMILGILSGDDQGLAQFFSIDADNRLSLRCCLCQRRWAHPNTVHSRLHWEISAKWGWSQMGYILSRAVGSTMAAESQAFCTATGTVEWLSLML